MYRPNFIGGGTLPTIARSSMTSVSDQWPPLLIFTKCHTVAFGIRASGMKAAGVVEFSQIANGFKPLVLALLPDRRMTTVVRAREPCGLALTTATKWGLCYDSCCASQSRMVDWLCTKLERKGTPNMRCIGNMVDGKFVGVVGFDEWNGSFMPDPILLHSVIG